jgi:superfamily II DNA helicase RecQ
MRTHEWFLERDYPAPDQLSKVFTTLGQVPLSRDGLVAKTGLDADAMDRTLEKLLAHNGAERVGYGDYVRGGLGWRRTYEAQLNHKQAQLLAMRAFTEEQACHMLKLISHFGDQEDSGVACGHCDICAPQHALSLRSESATPAELEVAKSIIHSLREFNGQAIGKLFRDIGEGYIQRKRFDDILAALRRQGYVDMHEDDFEKDGKVIRFMRVSLTAAGSSVRGSIADLRLSSPLLARDKTKRTTTRRSSERAPIAAEVSLDRAGEKLVTRLKEWRRQQAAENQAPAYTVLTDRAILGIASAKPSTLSELLKVHGIGPSVLDKYGRKVLDLISEH